MMRSKVRVKAAAKWLVELETAENVEDVWPGLQDWLAEHPRNRALFLSVQRTSRRLSRLYPLRPADGTIDSDLLSKLDFASDESAPASIPHPSVARARQKARTQRAKADLERRRWFLAAGVAALALAGALYATFRSAADEYETEIGGREQIALSDGSHVDLNTDSELLVQLTATRRDVTLVRGEAFFRVAHEARRPFYVLAGNTVVRAVGTEFSVRLHDDNRVEVLVTEGRVAMAERSTDSAHPVVPPSAAAVSASERATDSHGGVSIAKLRTSDVLRELAWTRGWLVFQGESLDEAVDEFNRYNRRRLIVADSSISQILVSGDFHVTDLDSFVDALEQVYGVRGLTSPDSTTVRLVAAPGPPSRVKVP